jgi:hypothetical protein
MRHDQIKHRNDFDIVEIATNEDPASVTLAEMELGGKFCSEAAAPDLPPAVGRLIAGAYVALIGVLAATMARNAESAFVISIAALFLVAFLSVPRIFLAIEPETTRRPSMSAFLERGMQTATGHLSGRGALVQMLVVPVLLSLGVLAIGIAGIVIL